MLKKLHRASDKDLSAPAMTKRRAPKRRGAPCACLKSCPATWASSWMATAAGRSRARPAAVRGTRRRHGGFARHHSAPCDDWGIEALTIYAFSTENWARGKDEVQALMGLLLKYFNSEIDELDEKNVRITILGDVQGMPSPQKEALIRAMERTGKNTGLRLNIALNYGGRAELVRAAKSLATQVAEGEIRPEDITEERFGQELYTAGQPDVDLLIRTSGEMRLSNFLPWQTAYAEMVFDSTLWPDFTRQNYLEDIRIYASRDRRFGGVKTGK